MHGYFREMGEWLSQFLERYVVADSFHTLGSYSFCLVRQGRFAESLRIAVQSLQMALTLSHKQAEAHSLHLFGALTTKLVNKRTHPK
jgi:hypothetical protein